MGKTRRFILGLLFLVAWNASAEISINEVMPCNISSYMDSASTYNFPGYVEFYNSGSSSVDLKGYKIVHEKLTGKSEYKLKWEWIITDSNVIPAKEYQLIFFDEVLQAGHSKYKLDSDGGRLYLYDASKKLVSQLTYPAMYTHISYGPDGYMEPSPKKENKTAVSSLSLRCAEPKFSGATPGVQNGNISVSISSSTPNTKIYYTIDGTEPNKNSLKYTSALTITSNTVIRARAYAEGYLPSSILTGSFLFLDSKHNDCGGSFTVPIVSLVVDEDYFYDNKVGICVKGTNGAPITTSCLGSGKANFMQDWKRPINFEYIVNGKQVLTHEAEAAVIGGCSRGYDVKSLKIKAGKKMGSGKDVLNYKFFADKPNNKYTSVHLRNGGNAYDPQWVRCRDGYMQSLGKVMNLDYQAYQPVAYFINGEYIGLMGLRERTNGDYVEANYGLDDENMDLIKLTNTQGVEATTGDADAYHQMVSFLENNDPKSNTYYEQAAKYIDMDEYIDYQIFEQFIVNTDWPGNNCKLWREKENGRFRWIVFDTDFGLGLYGSGATNYCDVSLNSLEWCTGEGSKINWSNGTKNGSTYKYDEEAAWKTTIFRHLMQNDVFKEKFLNRNLIHLGTTFTCKRVQDVWDSIVTVVKKEYCASFRENNNLSELSHAKSMIQFAVDRPTYVYKYLKDYYDLGSEISLDFSANISGVHFIMNDELVNMPAFSGRYFAGKQLKLEAIAPLGYQFSYWKMGEGSSSEKLLNSNSVWKYYYEKDGMSNTNWTKSSFDDSNWEEGFGKFGYASSLSDYNTVLDYGEDPENKYITGYFRNQFNLGNPSTIKNLSFTITYDDAFVLYINGTEVKRDNIEGTVTGNTPATTYKNDEEMTFKIDKSSELFNLLVQGTNTIAVEVHQDKGSSSDLTFKLNMTVNYEGGASSNMLTNPILVTTLSENKTITAVFEKISSTCPDIPLLISEIAPSNDSASKITDEYGNHPDWFEIYNNGTDTFNIAGLYLTDNPDKPFKSQIPYGYEETKLAPGGHFVFWADNKPFRGLHHVDFKLSNTNDESFIYLYRACDEYNPVDIVAYSPIEQNASLGRVEDSSSEWKVYYNTCQNGELKLYSPTPGERNGSIYEYCKQQEFVNTHDVLSSDVMIYPNPVIDQLNIEVKDAQNIRVIVYDELGKIRLSKEATQSLITLDVQSLHKGVYSMQIITDNNSSYHQFLKK